MLRSKVQAKILLIGWRYFVSWLECVGWLVQWLHVLCHMSCSFINVGTEQLRHQKRNHWLGFIIDQSSHLTRSQDCTPAAFGHSIPVYLYLILRIEQTS